MKKINSFASKEGFISAFTLAEMMVVMLILSIVLAAMAPVMTTRYKSKPNDSSPWKYEANNKLNAYFGTNPSVAMIGQNQYTEGTDISAKLLINLGNSTNFLGFKSGNTNLDCRWERTICYLGTSLQATWEPVPLHSVKT